MTDPHEPFMRRAIELSRQAIESGAGGPFGAVIVRDGEIVGEGHNQVTSTNDPTAHGEIVAIRDACRHLNTFTLEGCTIYTSCEPCPMCLAAIYWARLSHVYYGNSVEDAASLNFDDGTIYREMPLPKEQRAVGSTQLMHNDARQVFDAWAAMQDRRHY